MFDDPGHRRRRLLAIAVAGLAFFLVGWIASFGTNLYLVEKLPAPVAASDAGPALVAAIPEPNAARSVENLVKSGPYPRILPSAQDLHLRQLPTQQVFAFLPYLPETTYASLDAGISAIDVLMPERYVVHDAAGGFVTLDRKVEHQVYLQQLIDRAVPRLHVVPVVTVEHGALGPGDGGQKAATALAHSLANMAMAQDLPGLGVLPEGIDLEEVPRFAAFVRELDTALNERGLRSYLLASVDSPLLADQDLVASVDQFVLKLFEEPWIGTPPGPLAAPDWVRARVSWATDTLGADKVVFMLGSFAVDWSRRAAAPEQITIAEAFQRLVDYGGALDFPGDAGNMRIRYQAPGGEAHEIHALDAVGLYNQLAVLSDIGAQRVGLWSLGYEDPSGWPLFAVRILSPQTAPNLLGRVDLSDFVSYKGRGPFQRLLHPAIVGMREVGFDPETGLISEQGFPRLPTPWSLQRYGRAAPEEVALTFDDGPGSPYTEEILDILHQRDAPATFFVVGSRVLRSPELVRRMVADGHIVGSHTFLHPSIDKAAMPRVRLELNALQRLLVTIDGHGTVLFRTPYGRSEGPLTGADAAPMKVLADAGYLVVGSDVVPPDWLGLTGPEIVDYVMNDLESRGGNVIVLHDGGGLRQATVDALGPLIDRLRADGYRIVGLDQMLGVTHAAMMPPIDGTRVLLDRVSFAVIGAAAGWVKGLFLLLVGMGTLRSLLVLTLALMRRRHDPGAGAYAPPVTVVVPAYNEEATIVRCLRSIQASTYPDVRVIVVDDGSSDHTYDEVRAYAAQHPAIRVVREPNMGKWQALDNAYAQIDTEIVVAIDADSILAPDAITLLAAHFADPMVGAVAGRVRVGNRRGLLTRLQALEYLTAQGVDRRAFERLNAILVVPGAIGAWRKSAVRAAGLYSPHTLTEDADLTVSVNRAGYRVVYEDRAYAMTEVPERVHLLLRQRLRWSFGMLQTTFKHIAGAMRQRRTIGWIALPDLLLVGYVFSLIAPIVDLVLVGALLDLAVDYFGGRPLALTDVRLQMALGYALLPALDVVIMLVALRFDRSERIWLVLLFPIQRFFYRQLIYISALRAIYRAATGKFTHWGKLIRTGHARLTAPR